MSLPPQLSVIVPVHNAGVHLAGQLDALAAQEWDRTWEVILCDHASLDGSAAVAAEHVARHPHWRLVPVEPGGGAARARNTGLRSARGRMLLFCDADDVMHPGWLAAMARGLEHHDAVAGRLSGEALNQAWVLRARAVVQSGGLIVTDYPPYLPAAATAAFGVRREALDRVGVFDEDLPYLEDADLSWRLQLAGATLGFVPDAVMEYRLRQDLAGQFGQGRSYGRGAVELYVRYRPLGMPALRLRQGLRGWAGVVLRALKVRDRGSLAGWLWLVGWRIGRLEASVCRRVVAL